MRRFLLDLLPQIAIPSAQHFHRTQALKNRLLEPRFRAAVVVRNILLASVVLWPWISPLAQTKAASVKAVGDVTIDGKPARGLGNIFSGETLKTHEGAASIFTDGILASAGSHVSILYGGELIDMECGWVNVKTIHPFAVRVHDITVSPSKQEGGSKPDVWTEYEINQNAHALSIRDIQGQVDVNDGKQVVRLGPGDKRTFDRAAPCVAGVAYGPWVAGALFGASTFPIWEDLHDRHHISPAKP